ncbi:NUDIX domain-containing protein [Micromonospora sp. WMMD1128]|uniref:NUDIX hydrolase n=1 Tax=Micromonospora sp. WMMD1128 TaxID=3015150 RepID=UPI00248AF2AF|nr:NUDIX domain-containing protein [Micromonospora sp. WMMD1128]WBB76683.1 NUDIX domain-containing protein [Micromonospora sp. WMMD1128]
MAERIDIYNANLEPRGSMERIQAHHQGEWHRTFHCWIVSGDDGGALLLQKRSDTMRNFPGLLDVSAAGHLEAGEPVMAGLREVAEELGLTVEPERLHHLGERVEVADQSNGQRNREYQSVFLYRCDRPLGVYRPAADEVAALVWLPVAAGMELFTEKVDDLVLRGHTFERSGGQRWEEFTLPVTRDSFLPRIQRYYLTALIMAERLLSNAGPLAIS